MAVLLGVLGVAVAIWSAVVLNKMLTTVSNAARTLAAMGAKEPLDIGNRARGIILAWTAALIVGLGLIIFSAAKLLTGA